jgi:cytochrome c oxidase subunit 3
VHPQKFALWVAMASMTMFFAALTSALLVKKGDYQEWENFKLPDIFTYSTVVIVALSVVIQLALVSYRKAKFFLFRSLLFFSLLLGLLFLYLHFIKRQQLYQVGLLIVKNVEIYPIDRNIEII